MLLPSRSQLLRHIAVAIGVVAVSTALSIHGLMGAIGGGTPAWMEAFPGEMLVAFAVGIATPGVRLAMTVSRAIPASGQGGDELMWALIVVFGIVTACLWGSLSALATAWFRHREQGGRARRPPR